MSTPDFFRARLDQMIDLRHPLAVLATRMPWAQIEDSLAPLFTREPRDARTREDMDLFGPTQVAAGPGAGGSTAPRPPIRSRR